MLNSPMIRAFLPGKQRYTPSMDGMLEVFDSALGNFDTLIEPDEASPPRTPFDSDLPPEKLSMANMTTRQRMQVLPIMLPLLRAMFAGKRLYDGPFTPTRSEADPAFLRRLEALAMKRGASAVRYIRIPRHTIFAGKGIPHEYAIIITVEMAQEHWTTAPSFEAFKEVARGYRDMAVISLKLARFLRRNGYAGYPGTSMGGLTDYTYLAELAGMGAIGYHGMLISPQGGTRQRINVIYTNIANLPLETVNEHLWVREFCARCGKCVRACPAGAIFDQPRPRGDGGWQTIDHDACRYEFAQNFGCGVCLAVCPFSQIGYDAIQARFKGHPDAPRIRISELAL